MSDITRTLPIELVQIILSELDNVTKIVALFVCKQWKFLIRNNLNYPLRQITLCSTLARNGYLEVLKWVRANGEADIALQPASVLRLTGCSWDEKTCSSAALGGHLETLQWARTNGCPWDDWTCNYAALEGHFEILKWARDNGCPWNERTCSSVLLEVT